MEELKKGGVRKDSGRGGGAEAQAKGEPKEKGILHGEISLDEALQYIMSKLRDNPEWSRGERGDGLIWLV